MPDFLNINSSDFLGGTNVHSLIMFSLLGAITYKLFTN